MKKSFYIAPAIETSTIDDINLCAGTIAGTTVGEETIEQGGADTQGLAGDSRRANVWGDVEAEEDW